MAMFIRAKRVSDPLGDRVMARLLSVDDGVASSCSEHDGDESSLSDLVHGFFDFDEPNVEHLVDRDSGNASDDAGDDSLIRDSAGRLQELLDGAERSDSSGRRLVADVIEAAEAFPGLKSSSSSGSGYRRAVMARLRELGHDAAVCKVRWESSGGLTAGSYEYIDVVVAGGKRGADEDEIRYIVDLDFAGQFEIARATAQYRQLVALLPGVMVAKVGVVKQAVRITAEAAKRSMKSRELSVPPWRKRRYMVNKWFGPYRRSVNPLPESAGGVAGGRAEVAWRAMGFYCARQAQTALRMI